MSLFRFIIATTIPNVRCHHHLATLTAYYLARNQSKLLATEQATQELRWLSEVSQGDQTALDRMVHEVQQDKPIAYILGNIPFHPLPLPLFIEPPTLIPRPETEYWVNELRSLLLVPSSASSSSFSAKAPMRVLDIGTGSGCIPLALAYRSKIERAKGTRRIHCTAVDIAPAAIHLAQRNIDQLALSSAVVRLVQADLFSADFLQRVKKGRDEKAEGEEDGGFDLIVSNPPYITCNDYKELDHSVKEWEDRGALVGTRKENEEGLVYYERIMNLLPELLREGVQQTHEPVVVFEVGEGQSSAVAKLVEAQGLRSDIWNDQFGVQRVVLGYRKTVIDAS